MKLKMDKETASYFDKHGFLNSKDLEKVFVQSCKDQQRLSRQAARLRWWDKLVALLRTLTFRKT